MIFGSERGNIYNFTARLFKPELVYLCVLKFYGIIFSLVGINTKIFQDEHCRKPIPVYCSMLHGISKKTIAFGPLASSTRKELFQLTMAAASATAGLDPQ